MPNADLSKFLLAFSLLGAALLVTKLFLSGLWRHYPVFFWYFAFRIPNTIWPLLIDNGKPVYQHVYVWTEPIAWIFHVLVIVELCRLVLNRHRGIYSLLRWAMCGAVAIAIGASIVLLLPKINARPTVNTRLIGYYVATQRGIDFALAILILLILLFLSRYPVKLNRNILIHAALYTIFFFGGALTMFLHTIFGSSVTAETNLVLEFVSVACIFAWILFLSPAGERVQASFPTINPRHEQQALRQLENLNATLLKVAKR
jgi:hypothetical protein